jgi:hypothetical protein
MVLVRFTRVLEQHKGQIDDATYWRYRGGRLPKLLLWLAQRPDLAQALAEDAIAIASSQAKMVQKGGDA